MAICTPTLMTPLHYHPSMSFLNGRIFLIVDKSMAGLIDFERVYFQDDCSYPFAKGMRRLDEASITTQSLIYQRFQGLEYSRHSFRHVQDLSTVRSRIPGTTVLLDTRHGLLAIEDPIMPHKGQPRNSRRESLVNGSVFQVCRTWFLSLGRQPANTAIELTALPATSRSQQFPPARATWGVPAAKGGGGTAQSA
jgi:hypothetical protein